MKKFRDLAEVRTALNEQMPLDEFFILMGKNIERINDGLYRMCCDLDSHPVGDDGSKDSTPSFSISPLKELWYCFGCGATGDRFEYIQRIENLDHVDAIKRCADIQHFDLSTFYAEVTQEDMIRESLFDENAKASNIAHTSLYTNVDAMNYLLGRGMTLQTIEDFRIGYAPPLTNNQVVMFNTIPNSQLLQLDRVDQFNNAILFPVCDAYGHMRYFQSRPFVMPKPGMKYIGGSKSHPLYDENDRLFGFNIAKKNIRDVGGRLVGVEGAPDAIMCNQFGIPTVGFLGTVVNQKTVELLDRYRVTELILLLDGDEAGYHKSLTIAEKSFEFNTNVRIKIAHMPEGFDPDEFLIKSGKAALDKILNDAVYAAQYLIDVKWDEYGHPDTPTKKMEFVWAIQTYIIQTTDKVIQEILIQYISQLLGLDPVQIHDFYAKNAVNTTAKLTTPNGEEYVLAYAIQHPESIADLQTKFKYEDWYLTRHKYLFKVLIASEYFDIDSLYAKARNMGLDSVISQEWLNDLLYKQVDDIEFHLSDVEDKLIRRKSRETAQKLASNLGDMSKDASQLIDMSTSEIYAISNSTTNDGVYDATQQVVPVINIIHERMKNPNPIIGYSLGNNFKQTTAAILGAQTKTLNIVAANQTVGKTQLCQNFAMAQAVVQQIPTGWISLEMDSDRMTFRHLSILSGVPCTPLMTGNITIEEAKLVDASALRLHQSPFFLSERGHDLDEALSIAKRWKRKNNIMILYIDYLQLQYVSRGRGESNRSRELGIISKAWKKFSQDEDICVFGISQLGKTALHNEVAHAEDGAWSYEIAQDADNYITLKERDAKDIEARGVEKGNIILNVDKNRMGQRGIFIDIYADRPRHLMGEV